MRVIVDGQNMTISDQTLTVSGSVDICEVEFEFDSSWNGWGKTAVFEGSGTIVEAVVMDNSVQIPWEVLKKSGPLKIGVYGTKNAMVKPTIWSQKIIVRSGTPTQSTGIEPTPSTYAQILAAAENAVTTADGVADEWANVNAAAESLAAGSSATVSFENNTFEFGIPKGDKGDKGNTGATGATGATPNLSIGTVSTLDPGESATATITGTAENPILNLGIPQGDKGDKGNTGNTGATGATPDFSIGTVSTLQPGQSATATITGTAESPVLNLGLPQGAKGDPGDVANLAAAYSTSATYAIGDYCIKDGQLYRCTTAITTAEAWTAAHWTAVELGDDVSDLSSALNPLYVSGEYELIANSYWIVNGDSAGTWGSYNGWSRTKRIPCTPDEVIEIRTSVPSIYNLFFNSDTDGDMNASFNVVSGVNHIRVPSGAYFYALSNTTAAMQATSIKSIIDASAVKESMDTIPSIYNAVFGDSLDVAPTTPTNNGYYSGNIGDTISVTSGSGYYYPSIDLSGYIGKKVRISFISTGTTSTRLTAICDSEGGIGSSVYEKDLLLKGYADFDVSEKYCYLYISYTLSGSNLAINIIDGGIVNNVDNMPIQCVYVSATDGNDNNSGGQSAPFATLQKAVNSGALVVKVEAGEYKAFEVLNRKTPLTIMLDTMPNSYSTAIPEAPKIKVTTDDTTNAYGVACTNSSEIHLYDIWVDGSAYDSYYFNNVGIIECLRCFCCDTTDANSMGFRILNCNGVFRECKAWNVSKDGFNIHTYGTTEFINCIAHDCGDDGISHHEGCNGSIVGGEFYNCVKGGIASPYGGCNVNIYNAYSHDNKFGIYSQSGQDHNRSKGIITGCVIKNNTEYDLNFAKTDIIGWSNLYDTKFVYTDAVFTEFTS